MLDMDRLRNARLFDRIVAADEAAALICDGMTVATSGFTAAGYPKAVPLALARSVEGGKPIKITLWTGSSVGPELENELARVGAIARRAPMIRYSNRAMHQAVNNGDVAYYDYHLSHMGPMVNYGFLGDVDVAILEATAITGEGDVIPTTSVGNAPIFAKKAKKIIVEVNATQPLALEGLHDIYIQSAPGFRAPIPIVHTSDRIGSTAIRVGLERIDAIVESLMTDPLPALGEPDELSTKIAGNLIEFLQNEIRKGRMPAGLLPLQSGVGTINNAVFAGLADSPFESFEIFTELIQPSMFDLIDRGKISAASCTTFTPTPAILEKISNDPDKYRWLLVMRPVDISNHPELIRRLGVIALNTPLEVDIYGHANSTHIMGTRMMNAIGGSGDYMRNGYLSIFTTEATAKDGAISRIVPMVSHVDHTEHDWHVLITEQGVADLRGLSPRERARAIIGNCAHPDYRPALMEYVKRAEGRKGHTPHCLEEALSWHVRFEEKGTMRL